jgi:hypothetical protein
MPVSAAGGREEVRADPEQLGNSLKGTAHLHISMITWLMAGAATGQEVRKRRASSRPFSLSAGPLMPVRSFSAIRHAK